MGCRVTPGSPEPLGVVPDGDGVNAAFPAPNAEAVELCLFDAAGAVETERIRLGHRTGGVWHAHVAGVAAGTRYGLRVHGPFDPSRGHRFNPAKLLVDPWATRLDRPLRLDPLLFDTRRADPSAPPDEADSAGVVPKAIVEALPSPPTDTRPRVPWDRTILYELGVKAFTAMHPEVPEAQRGTFAGLGHPAVVGYLRDLGITTVEILPVAAWIDERHLPPLGLANAWGYNPIGFCAPDPRLAPGGWTEVRAAVEALHAAGLEVIVDVVLNHSGESDELGPTLSLRGLDNAAYYRLRPDDAALYVNDAGCGNVLSLDRPPALRLAMDALRTWAIRGGVDGFRFDLAATLGRRPEGFDPDAPLLQAIAQDPLLRDLKLIAEPWDIGPGGYQPGRFPAGWGEWNDRYRDDVRRFWRGDGGMAGAMATRLAGSQDVFGGKHRPSRGVNFITAHDGFTLADLVSHERKHNEANGEDNRDGTDANHSWNHGIEGPAADPEVRQRRLADQRALLATLLLSRGTPMISMGAEAGRTQHGNNNAYAQDNPLGWFDWAGKDDTLVGLVRTLCRWRTALPPLREDAFLSGRPPAGSDLPDVVWCRPDGAPMTDGDWHGDVRVIVAVFATVTDDRVVRAAVVLNASPGPVPVTLPDPREDQRWIVRVETGGDAAGEALDGRPVTVTARSVLLAEEVEASPSRRSGIPPLLLGKLAAAAGIAAEWWEETGVRHAVGDDTRRALLSAMGVPCGSAGEARDALSSLAEERDGRALAAAQAVRLGRPGSLAVAAEAFARSRALVLADENGATMTVPLPANCPAQGREGVDGRTRVVRIVPLPDLSSGRWIARLDGAPDQPCRLTVAPPHCFTPDHLAPGVRRAGVAAHLYAVRRKGDQGIGDFTALGELGRLTARAGGVTVGLNPMHALFGADRDRASPYHPSDRRFLDPIYLDVNALGAGDPTGAAAALLARSGEALSRLAGVSHVDYPGAWSLKRTVLAQCFADLQEAPADHPERRALDHFRTERGDNLQRFATFEALAEVHAGPCSAWPEAVRDPARAGAAADPDRVAFHAWLQMLCERQFETAARRAGLSLGFYRDLAVGAAPDGAEIWADPGGFARGVSIGAPPDLFSRDGQVWNLPPPNPLAQERSGGAAFGALLATNMRHAGALRIDHVMGLTRLFWVPDGARGADGAYVAAPFRHLAAQLALESHRARAAVVGEDLGTVPEGFRERLAAEHVLSYRVLWFERDGDGFRPPQTWPERSVACASTHDLPTLRGWWRGADIAERHSLGSLTGDDATAARAVRVRDREAVLALLRREGLLPPGPAALDASDELPTEVASALHALVARAPAVLALAQVDDLVGEGTALNLPGTDRERPNWRRRLAADLQEIFKAGPAQAMWSALSGSRPA
ncbi:glycogen debranching protein GlgX [Alsobacter sp. R-9]